MAQRSVTLQIPEELFERVQAEAEASERSPEAVLLESIDALFGERIEQADLDSLLRALRSDSDARLWAMVERRLSWAQTLRLRDLRSGERSGQLTGAEGEELRDLLQLIDRYMLLRSEALALLHERGHDVRRYFQATA